MNQIIEPNTIQDSYCTFSVGGLCCGIEVSAVQEVIKYQPTTNVPLAADAVHGLINLRGQIVTALDLRKRFALQPAEQVELQMNVVVRTENGPVSLLVDQIGDVVQVDNAEFEKPPQTIEKSLRELIRGAFKMKDRLLLILNTKKIIRLPEMEN